MQSKKSAQEHTKHTFLPKWVFCLSLINFLIKRKMKNLRTKVFINFQKKVYGLNVSISLYF